MAVDKRILEDYIERIYGYSVKKTYTSEEADELSSEILLAALQGLPNLKNDGSFEPWLWGVAANVSKHFRRTAGKLRTVYCYDLPEQMLEEVLIDEPVDDELYGSLRQKIAMLSNAYRQIIILYYYDGLTTKQISQRLGLPEGTVTWRLSEARKKLKKECIDMEESALRPVKMYLSIYGSGNYNGDDIPFPTVYIDDALSQNIIYYCYENNCSVEELARLMGVPAFYIEERINNLVKREALAEASKGRYQTNFIIWSDKHGIYCEENAVKVLMPIMDRLLTALDSISEDAAKMDFYRADVADNDLYYLYCAMAINAMSKEYNKLPYPKMNQRYDGHYWSYVGYMETGKHRRFRMGEEVYCGGKNQKWDFIAYNGLSGIPYKSNGGKIIMSTFEDIINKGTSDDTDSVVNAVIRGYLMRNPDGSFKMTLPVFTSEQKREFDSIAERHLTGLMPEYFKAVERFVNGYRRLFPKHLDDECARKMYRMFQSLFAAAIDYGQRTGRITMPSGKYYCDVLIQR